MDLAGQVERPHGEPQPPPVDETAAQAGLRLTHREPSCVHLTLPLLLRRVDFARPFLRRQRSLQCRWPPGVQSRPESPVGDEAALCLAQPLARGGSRDRQVAIGRAIVSAVGSFELAVDKGLVIERRRGRFGSGYSIE
jgi:hypothetical protein